MIIAFTLNGKPVSKDMDPGTSLLTMLRECGCSSVRSGCDTTNCGICTVWVEDTPILSCGYPAARAQGKRVTTLEGVRPEAEEVMALLAEEGRALHEGTCRGWVPLCSRQGRLSGACFEF